MRRIMMLVAVVALMAAMMVASALPAFAQPDIGDRGVFRCVFGPSMGVNVPAAEVGGYIQQGYFCRPAVSPVAPQN